MHPGMSELIIHPPFLRVFECLVCLSDLLELGFGFFIVLIYIGMMLAGETPVRFFDLSFRRRPRHPKDFVIVSLHSNT